MVIGAMAGGAGFGASAASPSSSACAGRGHATSTKNNSQAPSRMNILMTPDTLASARLTEVAGNCSPRNSVGLVEVPAEGRDELPGKEMSPGRREDDRTQPAF